MQIDWDELLPLPLYYVGVSSARLQVNGSGTVRPFDEAVMQLLLKRSLRPPFTLYLTSSVWHRYDMLLGTTPTKRASHAMTITVESVDAVGEANFGDTVVRLYGDAQWGGFEKYLVDRTHPYVAHLVATLRRYRHGLIVKRWRTEIRHTVELLPRDPSRRPWQDYAAHVSSLQQQQRS